MTDRPEASAAHSLASVTIDGRYTVERVLGRSERTITLKAVRDDIGQTVVVKVLRALDRSDPASGERFAREIKATASVQHPNVVTVFDAGTLDDGRSFYVMEHIEGRLLRDLITEEAPLAPERAHSIVRQVCAAVSSAHAAGILHRDLKPDSIFISDRNGRRDFVSVSDFAVAKIVGKPSKIKLTAAGMPVGTSDYMAPEKADPGYVAPTGLLADAAADVYAIGCIAFELLTGALPLTAPSILAQFRRRSTEKPDWPSDAATRVPVALREAVDHLLASGVSQRPGSGFDALRIWDRIDAKKLEWQGPTKRPRGTHSRSAVVTPRRPPVPGPAAVTLPERSAGPKRTMGRGMLERPDGTTALLLVREAADQGIFVSVFVDRQALRPSQEVKMTFPAPQSTGGKTILRGTVKGELTFGARSAEAYVELDRESLTTAYPHLKRRWTATPTKP